MPWAVNRFLLLLVLCAGIGLPRPAPVLAQMATPEEIKAAETASVPQLVPVDPLVPPVVMPETAPECPPPMPAALAGPAQFWVDAGLQLWFITPGPLPVPLLTTGNPADPIPGALVQPGTRLLFGNQGLDFGPQAGVHIETGLWLDVDPRHGLEIGGFWGGRQSVDYRADATSAGNPPIYVPLSRPELGREGSFTIADPQANLLGSAVFSSHSYMWGVEANGLYHLREDQTWDIRLMVGFEYLILNEDVTLTAYLRDPLSDVNTTTFDLFGTENKFYGGQAGTRVRWRGGRWTIDATGKCAVGINHETVTNIGSLTQNGAGVPFPGTTPGGILTQPTNIGTQSQDRLVFVPQGQLKLGYELAPRLHLFAAYDCLYWSNVVRPGDQIDRSVNRTQQGGGPLVGPARPEPLFNTSTLWVHGISIGITVQY